MTTNAWKRLIRSLAVLSTVRWLAAGCAQPPVIGTTTPLATAPSTPIPSIPVASVTAPTSETPPTTALLTAYPPLAATWTPAPYPAESTSHPTPYFSPTPIVHWNADVIALSWRQDRAYAQPDWLSNTVVKLAVYDAGFSEGEITADISSGPNTTPVAASLGSDWRAFSPHQTFVIECGDGLKLFRAADHQLISQTPLAPPSWPGVHCTIFIQWAPDESRVSFTAGDRAVDVWLTDGSPPREIADNNESSYLAWSPNSLQLAVVISDTAQHVGTVHIIDASGRLLHAFQFQSGYDGAIVGWLTDSVMVSFWRYTRWYYDVDTGRQLFSWADAPTGNGVFHQEPLVSPDGRWVFIDQGSGEAQSAQNPSRVVIEKQYTLYDVRTQQATVLLDRLGEYLGFAGWSPDSNRLYLVGRPAESISVSDPTAPFGLLIYDVRARRFTSLFQEAVQVNWNADQSWAFVAFAARDGQGRLGLDGGLWKPGTQALIGRWYIADQMVFQDPADDMAYTWFPGPIAASWSHNGRWAAVSDKFGTVRLIGVDGSVRVLTSDLNEHEVALRWSPDDRHLLIVAGNQAWIVTV